MRLSFSLFGSLTILSLLSVACSSASTTGGAGGTGTGGDATSGGTGNTTGGNANGVGGTGTGGTGSGGTGTGGTGTGGSLGASVCPATLDVTEPVLTGKTVTPIASRNGSGLFEGPVWTGEKLLISFIDWTAGGSGPNVSSVLELQGTTLVEFLAPANAGTNGMALRSDGKIVAASQRIHGLFAFDPTNAAAAQETIVDMYESAGFNSPNDLTIRADGTIYFTDPNWNCGNECPQGGANNRVYRVTAAGVAQAIDPPHDKPNGIALSPDGNTLYVGGNDAGIKKYALAADGTIGAMTDFAAQQGVDGMTVDCAGNVYATVNGDGKVVVFSPSGAPLGEFTGLTSATNVAFGGADRKTLYITHELSLKSVTLEVPGYPY